METAEYVNILVSREGPIGTIQLNRAKVLNALSYELMGELLDALENFDADPNIRVIVITGGAQVFSAGADISEMTDKHAVDIALERRFLLWDRIRRISKPMMAAVSGYCVGGGNELAMNCDLIVASETARFGQPEINIGVIPGAGGTQRLTRLIGKHRAMELILTGRIITANEAEKIGLVNRVVPVEVMMEETKRLAREIATKAPAALRLAKEAIVKAQETTLETGLEFERESFYVLFATEDKAEGMRAFKEKRQPVFRGK
jgi:enoyl-CoA hydratase